MTIILNTWIPRSYTHLREAYSKISKTKLDIVNVKLDEDLTFDIKNIIPDITGNFILTLVGVYSLVVKVPKNANKKNAIQKMKKVILESLIKNWHTVTYKQIQNEIIPFEFSTYFFSSNKNVESDNKLEMHFKKVYSQKNIITIQASQFSSILTVAIDEYISKMSEYYHKVDSIIKSLKGEFELSELKKQFLKWIISKKILVK